MEDYNNSAPEDIFSGEAAAGDNSKQNEEITSGKETVKKKAAKVAAERVKVEKPAAANSAKKAIKKALPKKAVEVKAETAEPKPAKIKKAAAKNTKGKEQTESEQKQKIKKQTAAKKQLPVDENPERTKQDAAIINPVPEQQQVFGEHAMTIMPSAEPEKQETALPAAEEQPALINTQIASSSEPDVPVSEPVIEPAAEEQFQVQSTEKFGEHSIIIMPSAEPEKQEETAFPAAEEQPALLDTQIASSPERDVAPDAEPAADEQFQVQSTEEIEVQPEAEPILPAEEMPVTEEQSALIDTQIVSSPEPDMAPDAEPAAEEQFQVQSTEETEVQPEAAPILPAEEMRVTEEPSVNAEPETTSAQDDSSVSAKSVLRKLTFQLKFYTKPGQSLYVTGNHSLLGNNVAENAFPLSYLNKEYWSGTLEIPFGEELSEDISYHYFLKDDDRTIAEWGKDKVIHPLRHATKEALFIDSWNASSFVENTFYTEPFQQVLLKDNFTEAESKMPGSVTHIFRVKAPLLAKGQTLCIAGSVPELGEWDTVNPLLLSQKKDDVWHTISLDLSNSTFPFTYKYGVFDKNTNQFIRYEDGKNRDLYDNISPDKLTVVSDGFAHLPYNGFKGAGVAIPVFSLRSENSFGAGEFTDLKLLVDWAKEVGLKLIQILPVNDTTATHTFADSYPYAAISAFALHPLYLHLPSIADKNHPLVSSFHEKQLELNSKPDVDYTGVMAAKWSFIKQVFPSQKQQVFQSVEFTVFFEENADWLIPYAAFCYFREKYNTADFNQWSANQVFEAEEINQLASSALNADEEISIYFFVQFHLHLQLREATNYAHQNGIILKGDIPIGIYRYSCDAWQEPLLFNMDMQAGAPPDDFAVKGQNWGFPTYNWQRMREDGFTWWKKRFKQMSYYFDAFRIDHILGFFRIWSIPMNAVEGIMGHFVPAAPVHINEFAERGIALNQERLIKPYINDSILSEIFGSDRENIIGQFIETSADGQYSFKAEFDTQRKVEEYFAGLEETEQNKKIKNALFDLISNVILFEAEGAEGREFHFRIAMDTTLSFRHLDGYTQYQLKEFYLNYFYRRQDNFWMKEAMQKLPELKRSTNMLICGEDLGMVPDCVPGVMKELAILSLEIQRMPKDPVREFFHPNDAPYLSVVTPSTHDMSTVRGWWEEDRAATQRFFNNELGQWGTAPYFCEHWINKIIVVQHLYSPAMWSIFQLQDLMGINAEIRRENPHEERINIPADPKHYWRYRMHLTLEQLIEESEFASELKNLIVQSGR